MSRNRLDLFSLNHSFYGYSHSNCQTRALINAILNISLLSFLLQHAKHTIVKDFSPSNFREAPKKQSTFTVWRQNCHLTMTTLIGVFSALEYCLGVRSFGMIQKRISDPRLLGPRCVKGTDNPFWERILRCL